MIIEPAERLSQVKEYYFAHKLRELRQRLASGEDIINLGIGNPDMSPPVAAIRRLTIGAQEPGHHGYQPYKGIPELRRAFADWYVRMYGVSLNPDTDIQPLIGSKEGIMHISMAFLNPGDQVLVPNPGYLAYASVARLIGVEPVLYDLLEENGWEPDLEALASQDLSRVKIMWVSYPHMPTGANGSEELFDRLVNFARAHNILLVNDNPYSLILNEVPRSILAAEGAEEVALELNSLSKSHHMAGWRVGMVAGNADYIKSILTVKSNVDSGMFLPVQQAAATALASPYEWHQEQNEVYAARRELIFTLAKELGCSFDPNQSGLFVWASIPDGYLQSESFADWLLDELGIFVAPGFIFGSNGEGYVRFSLCVPSAQIEVCIERARAARQVLLP